MPLRFWPFELKLCDSFLLGSHGSFSSKDEAGVSSAESCHGVKGGGEPWAQRSRVSALPSDVPVCCFHDNAGHWGEVSVLPQGLDEQAWGKFQLEAEAKDLG